VPSLLCYTKIEGKEVFVFYGEESVFDRVLRVQVRKIAAGKSYRFPHTKNTTLLEVLCEAKNPVEHQKCDKYLFYFAEKYILIT
jgi:hypothetical protein